MGSAIFARQAVMRAMAAAAEATRAVADGRCSLLIAIDRPSLRGVNRVLHAIATEERRTIIAGIGRARSLGGAAALEPIAIQDWLGVAFGGSRERRTRALAAVGAPFAHLGGCGSASERRHDRHARRLVR